MVVSSTRPRAHTQPVLPWAQRESTGVRRAREAKHRCNSSPRHMVFLKQSQIGHCNLSVDRSRAEHLNTPAIFKSVRERETEKEMDRSRELSGICIFSKRRPRKCQLWSSSRTAKRKPIPSTAANGLNQDERRNSAVHTSRPNGSR